MTARTRQNHGQDSAQNRSHNSSIAAECAQRRVDVWSTNTSKVSAPVKLSSRATAARTRKWAKIIERVPVLGWGEDFWSFFKTLPAFEYDAYIQQWNLFEMPSKHCSLILSEDSPPMLSRSRREFFSHIDFR